MNFVTPVARADKAGDDHPDHAFLDEHGVTDFELRFVAVPYEGLAYRFVHQRLPTLSTAAAGTRTITPWPIRLRTSFVDV